MISKKSQQFKVLIARYKSGVRGHTIIGLLIALIFQFNAEFVAAENTPQTLQLNNEEHVWLANHPEIVLVTPTEYSPFEFFDDKGRYRGVAVDYFTLLTQRLGIKLKIVPIADSIKRLAMVKERKADIAVTSSISSADSGSLLFTRPHIVMPGVIVGNKQYKDLSALEGKKLATISGSQWEQLIARSYPKIQLVRLPDMASALELVSIETVDAVLSDIATTSYYIHREGMTNIQIVGRVTESLELRIAIRPDWKIFNNILDKALASISAKEKDIINQQWIHIKKPSLLNSKTFWTISLVVGVSVLLGLVSILVWNRTLKKQVRHRTQSLDIELMRRYEAESALQAVNRDLHQSNKKLQKTQLHLIHAAKMESIGHLAAGIAHEVKNPLAIIRLGLDYLSPLTQKNSIDSEVFQDMSDAVERADSVISGLLNFSREDTLNSNEDDINRVIEDALNLVKHEVAQRNIDIVLTLDKILPMVVMDTSKMQQVFVNLFLNALQAMKSGGTIRVSSYPMKINAENHSYSKATEHFELGQRVIVVVMDDEGPGVDERQIARIFDPFFTTKPLGEGTGLGLSIIKNIINLHHGSIEVENRSTSGLSVKILLPLTKEQQA